MCFWSFFSEHLSQLCFRFFFLRGMVCHKDGLSPGILLFYTGYIHVWAFIHYTSIKLFSSQSQMCLIMDVGQKKKFPCFWWPSWAKCFYPIKLFHPLAKKKIKSTVEQTTQGALAKKEEKKEKEKKLTNNYLPLCASSCFETGCIHCSWCAVEISIIIIEVYLEKID